MKKKYAAMMLSIAIAPSLLAGCQSSEEKAESSASPGASPTASAAASAQGYNGKDNLKVSGTPATVTLFYPFGANGAPKGDLPVWQEVAKITNVTMKNVANESITDEKQSFNTMMSSGDLPDIIQGLRTNINPVISQGVFLPLDDLIDKHAPNIKKFLADYPEAKSAGAGPDGKIYTITGTLGAAPGKVMPSMGFFIRQDWLDKLGLKAPTTLEEYKKVLYAFRQQDPNGNKKQDEIPYFNRSKGIYQLFQLWDARDNWYIGEDDKVHQGKAEPQYRDAMKELSQWYKDGIIDPEIFTRGSQARQFMLGNNLGGTTIDWFASTSAVNDTAKAQVPDINFVSIAPPADIKGKVKFNHTMEPIHTYAWGISSKAKDPVTVIKFMDFFFTPAGERLMNFGIEGTHYDLVNNEPVMRPVALSNPAGFPNFLRSIGGGYEIGVRGSLLGQLLTMNEIGQKGFTLYEKSDWLVKPFPVLSFTADEKKTIDSAMVNLTPAMDEYEQKLLMGSLNADASWDKHIEEMQKLNLQKVLDAYNSAYARYKSELK
ncbi:MAG: sugar transporter permease [Paenibacillaceae bacterium]|jgi:putative aldouronate transport system substrate-binding protein|nr:sugar transporter permease [Paenibacillaceae bacterium]